MPKKKPLLVRLCGCSLLSLLRGVEPGTIGEEPLKRTKTSSWPAPRELRPLVANPSPPNPPPQGEGELPLRGRRPFGGNVEKKTPRLNLNKWDNLDNLVF